MEEAFESESSSDSPVVQQAKQKALSALQMLRRRFAPRPQVTSAFPTDDLLSSELLTNELATSDEEESLAAEFEFASEVETEPALEAESYTAEPYEEESYAAESYEAESCEAQSDAAESYVAESYVAESSPEAYEEFAEESVVAPPANRAPASWRWLSATWKGAPRDLKLVSLILPVLLVVAISGSLPKVPIHQLAPQNLDDLQGQVQKVVEDHWKNLNQTISNRAAVEFADDFRQGLDAWESRSNLTSSWSYDLAGFVRPGPLAIFKPTVDLTDYNFEFLGEIDQKALGWAFRAVDLNNYYAMKFVVSKPGPMPLMHIVRYAVINGKEGPHVDKPLPITVRADMLYRIQVNARGEDFTVLAQGQVVDFWSDNRLRHGGIGFFCNRGESARLRWVEVSHQYDALGRLCAYLAPYGIEGRNGNIN